jgi:hypothetical protein
MEAKIELEAVNELIALHKKGLVELCTNEYVKSELEATRDAKKRSCLLAIYRTLTLTPIHGIVCGAQSRKGPTLTAGSDKICGGHEEMEPIFQALKQVLPIPVSYTNEVAYWNFKGKGFVDAALLANMLAFGTADAFVTLDSELVKQLRNNGVRIRNKDQRRIIEKARDRVVLPSEAIQLMSRSGVAGES